MKKLAEFDKKSLSQIRYLLCDIDDTITTEGKLTGEAYMAIQKAERMGIKVIPITGRPAGWCDHIARMWPVEAVVGENGAFYFHYNRTQKKLETTFFKTSEERRNDRKTLEQVSDEILRSIPGTALASDQLYREADLAIDFCEDVAPLKPEQVTEIVKIFEKHGATAKISSIHVNGWFGSYDKLSMTERMFKDFLGIANLQSVQEQVVFIGDSPNDCPMFGYFTHSVGVANVAHFPDISPAPHYVTRQEGGAGFSELVQGLIDSRV